MADTAAHYKNLLAVRYSWMLGGAETRIRENRDFFQERGIRPTLSGAAVDLGCGPGFQSIPLAEAGFEVAAVDFSRTLLDELTARSAGLNIRAVKADIMDFPKYLPGRIELAVCMGDTLTHLESPGAVQRLFAAVGRKLETGGKFILSFRDLSAEPVSSVRFIPVRRDGSAVFSCFLEFGADLVTVRDILYTKKGEGWELKTGCYKKLRISAGWVAEKLREAGFAPDVLEQRGGMATVIAERRKVPD